MNTSTDIPNTSQPFRGVPEQLKHDNTCVCWAGGIYAAKCSCGEFMRDPELHRILRPKAYVAYLEAVGEHRPVTPYVAQYPSRARAA